MATFFSPYAILNHLFTYLPRLTDVFSTNTTVVGEIIDGTPQTLKITEASHGQSVGDIVTLLGAKISNAITAVALYADTSGNVLRFTTGKEHDLTLGYNDVIELSGFVDTGLNGSFSVVTVPSRTTFEIQYDTLPTLTGSERLEESREIGLDGLWAVTTVIDADNYTISLDGKPAFTPQIVPSLKSAKNYQLDVSVDVERARASYTDKMDSDKLALFVVMGDSSLSKDLSIKSDATQLQTNQQRGKSLFINTFSLVVFFPTAKDPLGAKASELAWNGMLKTMLAAGAGIKFDDFEHTNYLTSLIGHGTGFYNNAIYTHVYTFEYSYETTQDEEFLTNFIESRALRDNDLTLGGIVSDIDLDG